MTDPTPAGTPIEDYLDELLVASTGDPRQVRSLLAETEAHLHDATAEGMANGLDRVDAEREAVSRFGSVYEIADGERRRETVPTRLLVRDSVLSGLWLGSIAAVAVGLTGVIAAVLGGLWGSRFLVDSPTTHDLTASSCASWLAHATTDNCARAALADWSFETVGYRLAFGLVGVVGLGLWVGLRRRASRTGGSASLPAAVIDTIGALSFCVAGFWLTGMGIDALAVSSGHGAGQWLSAAPVALALGAVFAWRLFNALRNPNKPSRHAPALAT